MDIESIARELAEMKDVRIEAIDKNETEMVRFMRYLHDIDVLEIHQSICTLPSNNMRITVRIKLKKGAVIEGWVHSALTIAFEKTTLKFNSVLS